MFFLLDGKLKSSHIETQVHLSFYCFNAFDIEAISYGLSLCFLLVHSSNLKLLIMVKFYLQFLAGCICCCLWLWKEELA